MSCSNIRIRQTQLLELHLVGIEIGHALTPPVHSWVVESLGLPWHFYGTECPTIEDCVRILHSPQCAGLCVTMPWKGEIIKYLDRLDPPAKMLNACNCVYFGEHGELVGSNTDWIGIEGAIRAAALSRECKGHEAGLVIGAGRAARAAVYALVYCFGVKEVYILNRDDREVEQLIQDCGQITEGSAVAITHVKTVERAQGLRSPTCVVGSVPDFELRTPEEKDAKAILTSFLARDGEKGIVVDMCYKPRWTRHLKLAQEYGWEPGFGTDVVGWQVEALWRLWIGDKLVNKQFNSEGMWKVLRETAESSKSINP